MPAGSSLHPCGAKSWDFSPRPERIGWGRRRNTFNGLTARSMTCIRLRQCSRCFFSRLFTATCKSTEKGFINPDVVRHSYSIPPLQSSADDCFLRNNCRNIKPLVLVSPHRCVLPSDGTWNISAVLCSHRNAIDSLIAQQHLCALRLLKSLSVFPEIPMYLITLDKPLLPNHQQPGL